MLSAAFCRRSVTVVATALVCIGCTAPAAQPSQAPSGSAGATASESATASPPQTSDATPVASPAFEVPAGVLPPGSLATVTVDGLRIREEPGLSAHVVATANAGELVWTGGWSSRAAADGLDWYQVSWAAGYRDWPAYPDTWENGWVAAGTGDERYLELLPPRCPAADLDLATLAGMTEWERLSCFGDRSITVVGTFGCLGCGGTTAGTFEPMWLAYPLASFVSTAWEVGGQMGASLLTFRIPPDSGIEYPTIDGSVLRLKGHFNDSAASTCVMTYPTSDVSPQRAELACREQFVVDGYEVTATDPNFPGGG